MKIDIPCKVGDEVWGICRRGGALCIRQGPVKEMYFATCDMRLAINVRHVCIGEWGKQVFATKTEAYAAMEVARQQP